MKTFKVVDCFEDKVVLEGDSYAVAKFLDCTPSLVDKYSNKTRRFKCKYKIIGKKYSPKVIRAYRNGEYLTSGTIREVSEDIFMNEWAIRNNLKTGKLAFGEYKFEEVIDEDE